MQQYEISLFLLTKVQLQNTVHIRTIVRRPEHTRIYEYYSIHTVQNCTVCILPYSAQVLIIL